MRRLTAVAALLAIAVHSAHARTDAPLYVVVLKTVFSAPEVHPDVAGDVARAAGVRIERRFGGTRDGLNGFTARLTPRQVARVEAQRFVEAVEPDGGSFVLGGSAEQLAAAAVNLALPLPTAFPTPSGRAYAGTPLTIVQLVALNGTVSVFADPANWTAVYAARPGQNEVMWREARAAQESCGLALAAFHFHLVDFVVRLTAAKAACVAPFLQRAQLFDPFY